jgi:hypothetical protein
MLIEKVRTERERYPGESFPLFLSAQRVSRAGQQSEANCAQFAFSVIAL